MEVASAFGLYSAAALMIRFEFVDLRPVGRQEINMGIEWLANKRRFPAITL